MSDKILNAYFQGGDNNPEEPTPKKKKYKSDRAIVVQPRFKEPFYHNYDYVSQEGVDGPAKHGPGTGYHSMQEFKSIKDFLDARRKKMKNKYKSDDSYIEDDGKITKGERKTNKIARRMLALSMIKNAIDFPTDDQIQSTPLGYDAGSYESSVQVGGISDVTAPDFEGKGPDQLNYGRDYEELSSTRVKNIEEMQELFDKMLNAKEPDLFGLPDGIVDRESTEDINNKNNYYGILETDNPVYNKNVV